MAVTEDKIDITGTNDALDTSLITNSTGDSVHRESVVLSDPMTNLARSRVKANVDIRDYAQTAQDPLNYQLIDIMREVLSEMKITNFHLSLLTETTISKEDIDDDYH